MQAQEDTTERPRRMSNKSVAAAARQQLAAERDKRWTEVFSKMGRKKLL